METYPGLQSVIVARGITAPVKIQRDCVSAFFKRLAHAVLGENNQRDGSFNPRAAPAIYAGKCAICVHGRGEAHDDPPIVLLLKPIILQLACKHKLSRARLHSFLIANPSAFWALRFARGLRPVPERSTL